VKRTTRLTWSSGRIRADVRVAPHRRDPRDNRKAADPSALTPDQALALRVLSGFMATYEGLTDFELAERMGRTQPSAGKRRLELERAGLVEFAGKKRPTGNGGTAGVHRATLDGYNLAERLSRQAAA